MINMVKPYERESKERVRLKRKVILLKPNAYTQTPLMESHEGYLLAHYINTLLLKQY
jgi:hypothetical protein